MLDKKPSGLENVVVADSKICFIDGKRGQLVYRGYDIDDLVQNSSFEEVAYLLWHGDLPTRAQLEKLRKDLNYSMVLPARVLDIMQALPFDANPMRVLETSTSALGTFDPLADDSSPDANLAKAVRLTAQLPMIVSTWDRIRNGQIPVDPDPDKGIAFNLLKMLTGHDTDAESERVFDAALILHADHELNASTFSARVTAATLSDMHSAVTSAIATLKGPLHGGANEAVASMLIEIRDIEHVDAYMQNLLAQKKKVMGFGHRVYKAKDPRAVILERMSEELAQRKGDTKWFDMSRRIEEIFQPIVAEKGIYPNVDFYSASTYHVLGIPRDLFTPIFACSRVVGWTAHLMEQYANNRLFRPDSNYIGNTGLKYAPIDQRG
ncbi:MAG TPA: citrate synthase [Abditibacteriaceae bacterium]|jgi:citrate synthase